jgi:3-oxoacyl-[acyl-carrier protein] reductase
MSNHPVGLKPGDDLAGKVAIVTGGARNIGRSIARALGAGGAAVMVHAHTSKAEAEQTAAMIKDAGGKAAVHLCDVTDAGSVAALVDATVRQFGRIDCLVNNAVFRYPSVPLADIKLEEWRGALAVVLDGAFLCSQACLPHLLKSGAGAIVNLGGLTGHEGAVNHAHLVTAKAGLAGMTKALGRELAPGGITVNCVVPGKIDTVRGMPGTPERSKEHARKVPPVGRFGAAEEVAAMVRMLCGPEGRYITGQSIHINGGILMP